MADRYHESFLPLKPRTFQVLLALHAGPRHGYGVKKEVAERTGGKIQFDPGGLYRLIGRLEDEGMVEAAPTPDDAPSGDARRRYYRLTDLGRAVLRADARRLSEVARWSDVVALAHEEPFR